METVKNYTKFKIGSTNVLALVVSYKESHGPLGLLTREKNRVLICGSPVADCFPSIGKALQSVEEDLYSVLWPLSRKELVLAYKAMSREYLDLTISHLNTDKKDGSGRYEERTLPRLEYLPFKRKVEDNFFDYVGRIEIEREPNGSIKSLKVVDRDDPEKYRFISKKYLNHFLKHEGKIVSFRAKLPWDTNEIEPVLNIFD